MKTILISGATGFIATAFKQRFATQYKFVLLSHNPTPGHIILSQLNPQLIQSVDIVLNLAGASIGAKRWSHSRKEELVHSRLNTTTNLVQHFNQFNPQALFICASAIGIYPPNCLVDESTTINYATATNFSQALTRKWEAAALKYNGPLSITRFGLVLGSGGGVLPQILRPFLLGLGGPIGNGLQHCPWIALTDLLAGLDYLIKHPYIGVVNLVAPQIIDNNHLSKAIATIWNKPNCCRVPAWLIKFLLGQMGNELLLNDLIVKSQFLELQKFKFTYPTIDSCLSAIKAGKL
jgi:uncharacterized protein (TIGR01777 family)